MTEMKTYDVCAVVVTYDNRFHMCKKVIDGCLRNNVKKIIIVDNGSNKICKKLLEELSLRLKNKLKIISLEKNLGSAGGYKRGLEVTYTCADCEFIWLLDDDTVPNNGALKSLINFYEKLRIPDKKRKIALLSYRKVKDPSRIDYYTEAIHKKDYSLLLGTKNSFWGFHIFKFYKELFKIFKKSSKISKKYNYGVIPVAPYAGLFFNKLLIEEIGYPNEKLFVYYDDTEWTYRITQKGGKIYLIFDSVLNDIGPSWDIKNRSEDFRIYYGIRNRVYFEKSI
jgi:GT2 family glycosyltransferase